MCILFRICNLRQNLKSQKITSAQPTNKRVTQLPGHSSLRFKLRLRPAIPSFIFHPPRTASIFFFFFFKASSRAHFQPLFLYGLSLSAESLCDPFHRSHHGNLVRPGKNAPRHTQGHILCNKTGGERASGSLFFPSFSSFPCCPPSNSSAGMERSTRRVLCAWKKKKKHCFL